MTGRRLDKNLSTIMETELDGLVEPNTSELVDLVKSNQVFGGSGPANTLVSSIVGKLFDTPESFAYINNDIIKQLSSYCAQYNLIFNLKLSSNQSKKTYGYQINPFCGNDLISKGEIKESSVTYSEKDSMETHLWVTYNKEFNDLSSIRACYVLLAVVLSGYDEWDTDSIPTTSPKVSTSKNKTFAASLYHGANQFRNFDVVFTSHLSKGTFENGSNIGAGWECTFLVGNKHPSKEALSCLFIETDNGDERVLGYLTYIVEDGTCTITKMAVDKKHQDVAAWNLIHSMIVKNEENDDEDETDETNPAWSSLIFSIWRKETWSPPENLNLVLQYTKPAKPKSDVDTYVWTASIPPLTKEEDGVDRSCPCSIS